VRQWILDDVANGTDSRPTAGGASSTIFLSLSSCPWRPSQVLPRGEGGGASGSAATPPTTREELARSAPPIFFLLSFHRKNVLGQKPTKEEQINFATGESYRLN
jgi:hypothetical protein